MKSRDEIYEGVAQEYAAALSRLARAYEADPEKRRDLLQEIHLQLWRSFDGFNGLCSLRTWVYRIAHNAATSHVIKERRIYGALVSLTDLEDLPTAGNDLDRQDGLARIASMIQQLKPIDRQVMLSYLEGFDAAATAEITGLSPANVAMKIHRIKTLLARRFKAAGGNHGQ